MPEPGLCWMAARVGQRWQGTGQGGLATPLGFGGSGCQDATSQRSSLRDLSWQCRACCALISPLLPAPELVLLSLPPHSRRGFSPHLTRVSSPPGAPYVPPTRVAGAAQARTPDECLGESCLHKIVFPSPSPGMCFIPRPERPSCRRHVPPAPPPAPLGRGSICQMLSGISTAHSRCSAPPQLGCKCRLDVPSPREGLSCRQRLRTAVTMNRGKQERLRS